MGDFLTDCIGWIFLGTVILVIFVPLISKKIYKGHIRRIKIVKKRTTSREALSYSYMHFSASNYVTIKHNTVDFTYNGKKIIHTFNCYESVFSKLHKGMVYGVIIRYNTITKIIEVYK